MVYPVLGFIIGLSYFFLRFNYLYKNGHLESKKSITKYLNENDVFKTTLITILSYLFYNVILNLTESEKHVSVIIDYIYLSELILILMVITGTTVLSITSVIIIIVAPVLPLVFYNFYNDKVILLYYILLFILGAAGVGSLKKLIYKDM